MSLAVRKDDLVSSHPLTLYQNEWTGIQSIIQMMTAMNLTEAEIAEFEKLAKFARPRNRDIILDLNEFEKLLEAARRCLELELSMWRQRQDLMAIGKGFNLETVQKLEAENAKLLEIVKARTHREKGCICERCVEGEYHTAKIIESVRSDNAALRELLVEAKDRRRHDFACDVYSYVGVCTCGLDEWRKKAEEAIQVNDVVHH